MGTANRAHAAADEAAQPERRRLRSARDVRMRAITWIDEGRLPLGEVPVLAGFGGLGKSGYVCALAGRISRGRTECSLAGSPRSIVFCTAENSWEHTLKRRLVAADADLDRAYFVAIGDDPDAISIPEDLPDLEELLVDQGDVALVVFDPLVAFLSAKTDAHGDHDTRRALGPSPVVAQRTEISVPGVSDSTVVSLTRACPPCTTASREGSWAGTISRDFTHCSGCHVTFPASQRWGHCARCHLTFSGVESFDLHQRVDRDTGDFTPDCLCTVATSRSNQELPLGAPSERRWDVGGKTLNLKQAEWGSYWGQDAPDGFGAGQRTAAVGGVE
jgi:hypothetical protein